ncbi:Abhydrolase family protein [Amphibacillus marinus]|uniref:Abhydrolase family protein n=1 Tax=Amphibacillus marinus TaxID=872970 RepID=A0A1H8R9P8_9BACI|nr:alpha/beta hydrolase family protein [Amphibacillus marinus]SEO63289.1 Abhydrolase family protein [Amphibacillus marinus]
MDNALNQFLEILYAEKVALYKNKSASHRTKEQLIKGLQQRLGFLPKELINQPELLTDCEEEQNFNGFSRKRIRYLTANALEANAYILTPDNALDSEQLPTVIALHGHGYGNKEVVGLTAEGYEDDTNGGIHNQFAIKLVNQGFKVIAPELIGIGGRMLKQDLTEQRSSSCDKLTRALMLSGITLAGLRVYEITRLLDIIKQFNDVDQSRIGIMGFSGGGLVAGYSSILDKRIQATVLTGFTNTFKGSILASQHCIDNYLPDILAVGELPELLSCIAPRPLFIESGINDPIFPIASTKEAVAFLENVYRQEVEQASFAYEFFEGRHEVKGDTAIMWLKENL